MTTDDRHGQADLLQALKLASVMSDIERLDLRRTLRLIAFVDLLRDKAIDHATMLQGESLPPGSA